MVAAANLFFARDDVVCVCLRNLGDVLDVVDVVHIHFNI